MEHAERLCDRIILMAGGRKVFDGSTEEALAKAPRRMVIGSDTEGIADTVTPFAKSLERREDGALDIILKDDAKSQDVLERCVKQKVNLTRFEPKQATPSRSLCCHGRERLTCDDGARASGGRTMKMPAINMRRTFLIARRDYLGYVKTWGFWISFFL